MALTEKAPTGEYKTARVEDYPVMLSSDGFLNATMLVAEERRHSDRNKQLSQFWVISKIMSLEKEIEQNMISAGISAFDARTRTVMRAGKHHKGTYIHPRMIKAFLIWLNPSLKPAVEFEIQALTNSKYEYTEVDRAVGFLPMQDGDNGEVKIGVAERNSENKWYMHLPVKPIAMEQITCLDMVRIFGRKQLSGFLDVIIVEAKEMTVQRIFTSSSNGEKVQCLEIYPKLGKKIVQRNLGYSLMYRIQEVTPVNII